MFVKFTGNPFTAMGSWQNANAILGNEVDGITYLGQTHEIETVTYLNVTDENVFNNMFSGNTYYTEMDSLDAINAEIESINYYLYNVSDSNLLESSLITHINNDIVNNISDLNVDMIGDSDLERFYGLGVSGIDRRKRYEPITL